LIEVEILTSRIPQDALSRAKAAKDENPTTLLTRFAEELRRAPGAGPDKSTGQAGGNVVLG